MCRPPRIEAAPLGGGRAWGPRGTHGTKSIHARSPIAGRPRARSPCTHRLFSSTLVSALLVPRAMARKREDGRRGDVVRKAEQGKARRRCAGIGPRFLTQKNPLLSNALTLSINHSTSDGFSAPPASTAGQSASGRWNRVPVSAASSATRTGGGSAHPVAAATLATAWAGVDADHRAGVPRSAVQRSRSCVCVGCGGWRGKVEC